MNMLYIAICDTDVKSCDNIEKMVMLHVVRWSLRIEIDKFYDSEEMLSNINSGADYDVIIMNTKIGKTSGFEIGEYIRKELNNQSVSLVYVSDKPTYDLSIFNSRPLYFMLKPVKEEDIDKMFEAIDGVRNDIKSFFGVKNRCNVKMILYKDIIYFTCKGRKLVIVTTDGEYSCYGRICDLDPVPGFILIHKSYLININYVEECRSEKIILTNGDVIPISRPYRLDVREYIDSVVETTDEFEGDENSKDLEEKVAE